MPRERFEFFSDGIIAIVITIMILEISPPDTVDWPHILHFGKDIFTYFISFFLLGNYWYMHCRLTVNLNKIISLNIIWHNLLFLFSISLMPLFTKWIITAPDSSVPVISYIALFILLNISYQLLRRSIITKERSCFAPDKASSLRFWVIWAIWIGVITVLSICAIIVPYVTGEMLIGLPLLSCLLSYWARGRQERMTLISLNPNPIRKEEEKNVTTVL